MSASVNKQRILIGEQFQLTLEATFLKNQKYSWFRIDTIPHFEILSKAKIDTTSDGNQLKLSQQLTLTSWDSGKWQIPAFSLSSLRTKPLTITVAFSSPFDPNQPYHDIKDILEVERPIRTTWYWYLIGAVLLLLLFILLFPRRKKGNKEVLKEDAYKYAMKQLKNLEQRGFSFHDPKDFYTELVLIFRTYLHQRKNIQSFYKTTDDLAVQIGQLNLAPDLYKELLQTLRSSDMVKFAKFQPQQSDNQQSFEVIKNSIVAIENVR
ncbi:MAG: hypothetical protein ICV66_09370 [Chitinophagaceae bacterium]|nr:hypothetical protein [Chitinophagaceae bacterium]